MSLDSLFILLFISAYFLLPPSSNLLLLFAPSPVSPPNLAFLSCLLRPVLLSAGETFSESYSLTEQCQPCTECTGLMRMETPCTDSNNAVCICNYNYYFDSMSGQCTPCTVCPAGQGVYAHCEHNHDTVCEECEDDTFSDRESSLDPCLPCTICEEDTETLVAECTPISDSVCHSKSTTCSSRYYTFTSGNWVWNQREEIHPCFGFGPFRLRPTANKQRVTTGQVNHSLDSFGILSVVRRLIA